MATSVKFGIDAKTDDPWLEKKAAFIRARDRLLELARRGKEPRYRKIVDNWSTVGPAEQPLGLGQTQRPKVAFEKLTGEKLEFDVYAALGDCHNNIRELGTVFRSLPSKANVDFDGLTEEETALIKKKS